jgi:hypothetical protein
MSFTEFSIFRGNTFFCIHLLSMHPMNEWHSSCICLTSAISLSMQQLGLPPPPPGGIISTIYSFSAAAPSAILKRNIRHEKIGGVWQPCFLSFFLPS